jgi:hypothetical protein
LFGVPVDQVQRRPASNPAGALARRQRLSTTHQLRAEVLAHQPHHLVVIDVACDRHHHPLGNVAADVKRMQLRPSHRRYRVDTADHGAADGMAVEHRRKEHITDRVLGVVVAHRDFLEHHVAFEIDIVCGAPSSQHHIGHQVDRQLQIGVEHAYRSTDYLASLVDQALDRLVAGGSASWGHPGAPQLCNERL